MTRPPQSQQGLTIAPDAAEALNKRGNDPQDLKRYEGRGPAKYDEALAIRPDYVEARYNRAMPGRLSSAMRKHLASYDAALGDQARADRSAK